MRELFQHRGALLLWIGQTLSTLGDFFTHVALLILIQQLTGSALALGGLVASQTIALLLLGPLAGTIVDRYDRRKLMICTDVFRGVLTALVPFLDQIYQFYVFAFLLSAAGVFFLPARNAVLPRLVDEKLLVQTNSFFAVSDNIARIVGPSAAGLLIAWQGLKIPFWVDAATFMISACCVSLIVVPRFPSVARQTKFWDSLKEGLWYILQTPLVRTILFVRMLVALGGGAINVLLVILAKQIMGWNDQAFGLALSTIATGSFIGSLWLSYQGKRFDPQHLFSLGTFTVGLAFVGLASNPIYGLALFFLFVDGLADSAVVVSYPSLVQKCIPDQVRGRVFGTAITLFRASMLVSASLSGVLAETIGANYTIMLAGSLVAIGGVLAWITLPHLSKQ